jgi:hypothetical protein
LEPDHWPRYPFFAPFEYDFYRALAETHRLTDVFRHLHQPRDDNPSDHSALTMHLAINPAVTDAPDLSTWPAETAGAG